VSEACRHDLACAPDDPRTLRRWITRAATASGIDAVLV
jgi:hypothetical protein